MRLWHRDLIPYLSNQKLREQHRECCALRGKGWGKKHSTVDYVFNYPFQYLYEYHTEVLYDMVSRDFFPRSVWFSPVYRGKLLNETAPYPVIWDTAYPEHNKEYLCECASLLLERSDYMLYHKHISTFKRKQYLRSILC